MTFRYRQKPNAWLRVGSAVLISTLSFAFIVAAIVTNLRSGEYLRPFAWLYLGFVAFILSILIFRSYINEFLRPKNESITIENDELRYTDYRGQGPITIKLSEIKSVERIEMKLEDTVDRWNLTTATRTITVRNNLVDVQKFWDLLKDKTDLKVPGHSL